MRAFLLGLAGGLTVVIPLAIVLLVMPAQSRARPTPTPDARAALLREVDEYEAWLANGNFGTFNPLGSAQARYLTQHPDLARYRAWVIDERHRQTFTPAARHYFSPEQWDEPEPADLRQSALLDRYLARR